MAQGFLARVAMSPAWTRRLMNAWPPFRAAGVRVTHIAPDWREATIELRAKLLNRNYVGTHFGGSIFAMADPFHMILMMRTLGRDYVVWDKAASVRFLKPGRGTLKARVEITPAMVEEAKAATAAGSKFEPTYAVEITDEQGAVVARVEKTLHIRRADSYRPAFARA
jgi:acyl-coenzyme A thioesterase PaaI-like protein